MFVLFGVFSIDLDVGKGRGFFPHIASPAVCYCCSPAPAVLGGGGMLIHEMWSRLCGRSPPRSACVCVCVSPSPTAGENGQTKGFAGEHGARRSRRSPGAALRTPHRLPWPCPSLHTQPRSHPSELRCATAPALRSSGGDAHGRASAQFYGMQHPPLWVPSIRIRPCVCAAIRARPGVSLHTYSAQLHLPCVAPGHCWHCWHPSPACSGCSYSWAVPGALAALRRCGRPSSLAKVCGAHLFARSSAALPHGSSAACCRSPSLRTPAARCVRPCALAGGELWHLPAQPCTGSSALPTHARRSLQGCGCPDLCSHSYKHAHAQARAHLAHTIHAWSRCVGTHTQAAREALPMQMCDI